MSVSAQLPQRGRRHLANDPFAPARREARNRRHRHFGAQSRRFLNSLVCQRLALQETIGRLANDGAGRTAPKTMLALATWPWRSKAAAAATDSAAKSNDPRRRNFQ